MSVIFETDKGWVISHYDYTKKIYSNVLSHSGSVDLTYSSDLFNIITPIMRDGQAKNYALTHLSSEKEFVLSEETKMKRKRKSCSSQFQHEINIVLTTLPNLIDGAQKFNYLTESPPNEQDYLRNNQTARQAAQEGLAGTDISAWSERLAGGNESADSLIARISNRDFVIPPQCSFVSDDIRNISSRLVGSRFDFILMDPPWWNKFIRRKMSKNSRESYSMLNNIDIQNIPISSLLLDHGLVAVWCTNAPSHIIAVKEDFFKAWGLEYVATWYWIKVTASGQLISSLEAGDTGKKPYERIIFGAPTGRCSFHRNPPPDLCLVSVPSSIHSQKPPLCEIISRYLPENPKCLELFARYLLPGWTSMGNEVLRFQSLSFFKQFVKNV